MEEEKEMKRVNEKERMKTEDAANKNGRRR